jgi:RNA polymerase sigma-70 factor (ECF subfamily)
MKRISEMENLRELSDSDLVVLFESGNIAAFEEIYNRYWLKLYAAAFKRLNDREGAKEIVQDFFTGFWINRAQVNIRTSLQGYLFTSIKYLVLNHKRAEAVRNTYSELLALINNNYDNSTEESYNYRELKQRIQEEVILLPPKCRSVFELSRNQYKTNKEIASLLGISEKTVENHLTKALRYLRVNLNTLFLFILYCIYR